MLKHDQMLKAAELWLAKIIMLMNRQL